jgi:hypothetical protein
VNCDSPVNKLGRLPGLGRRRVRIWALITLLLGGLFGVNKSAWAGNRWEYWSHCEAVVSVNDNLDFKVKPESRYNDDFSTHYYTHIDIGLDWKVKDWFILSPYYRHVNEKKEGDWKVEYRPHLNATFEWKLLGLSFGDRNRLEYCAKEDKGFFRYRNKLTVKLPKFTRLEIQPYVAEEPFYDFDENEMNKNRAYAGVDFKAVKNLKAGLHYIFESRKKSGKWTDANVLGTTLEYSF